MDRPSALKIIRGKHLSKDLKRTTSGSTSRNSSPRKPLETPTKALGTPLFRPLSVYSRSPTGQSSEDDLGLSCRSTDSVVKQGLEKEIGEELPSTDSLASLVKRGGGAVENDAHPDVLITHAIAHFEFNSVESGFGCPAPPCYGPDEMAWWRALWTWSRNSTCPRPGA
eukprot:Hpha_TRINITY_DN34604_c0_g1::TRINITY_DN34604_c0_g1_i1::g.20970::m.20970